MLTDSGALVNRIADPAHKLPKTYWVQVEGVPDQCALKKLRAGVQLKDGLTLPAEARLISEPENLWARSVPVRERKAIPTSWLELAIREGKNRQIRRMTAAVGHPTLRLIRSAIGEWSLNGLAVGQWREVVV